MKSGILSSFNLWFSINITENKFTNLIKGKDMRYVFDSSSPTEIELRFCIAKKYMRIADYPNYESVCKINDITAFNPAV